jgi:cytochrome d ubiquinol oxidase subunit I
VINGVLRTADAVTPASGVPTLFYGFAVLYAVLAVSVVVLLLRLRTKVDRPAPAPQEA